MGRRCSRGDGCARTALLLAALATTSWESRPGSLLRGVGATGSAPPRDGALQPDASLKLVITPTFGQCFSNGTTTFRSNAPVKWTLFPMDGNVPYTTSGATPTSLTLRAGRHGGRMLVVAAATACAAGSPCAEQLGSPACAGVAAGETTLAQVGANLCSAAFANASWTVVPWWKVVGVTLMLTSLGVLFALAVVARLRLSSLDTSAAAATGLGYGGYGLPAQVNNRLAMAFGSQTAPLFATQQTQQAKQDAASIYA